MGIYFFDQYSILHLAVGIVMYFLGVALNNWIIIHIIFEIVENTETGILFINNYLRSFWPGGKERADEPINSIGDCVFGIIGWFIGYYFDELGKKNKWYIKN